MTKYYTILTKDIDIVYSTAKSCGIEHLPQFVTDYLEKQQNHYFMFATDLGTDRMSICIPFKPDTIYNKEIKEFIGYPVKHYQTGIDKDNILKIYEMIKTKIVTKNKKSRSINSKSKKTKNSAKSPSNSETVSPKKTRTVKKTYKNVDEIFDSIIKSSYIPFVIDGNLIYQNKYIDGINPYIFDLIKNTKTQSTRERKILFMNLMTFDKIEYTLNVKNEKTNFHRILSGMLDIHNFFIKGSQTQMCSYVNNWSLYNYFYMSIRYFIEKIIIYKVYFLSIINRSLSKEFKHGMVCKFVFKMWKEIIIMVIHSNFYSNF
jgi:hypothetical protein